VAQCGRQGVGGIRSGCGLQAQQCLDHMLDLLLFGVPMPDYRLFDLGGAVFKYR
jgi:hypothetical protein